GLSVVCPITTKAKGYPFEVPLPAGSRISGAVLADHIKSVDWRERKAEFAARLPRGNTVVDEVKTKLGILLRFDFV
ncbi:MAG TPA: type II toxin-antitoxin system PemK/MazF family toxin, partial [Pyrinomonadaceae bacterium]|nr:type II toxin-antitoxin system PemK/MazF family toxin [Pyrinomonadaceae bacterium]